MKPGIHPEYYQTSVTCACGNTWTTGATTPEIRVDVCNKCHPFFTGQQRIVDTLGRVERLRGHAQTTQQQRRQDGQA